MSGDETQREYLNSYLANNSTNVDADEDANTENVSTIMDHLAKKLNLPVKSFGTSINRMRKLFKG